MSQINKMNKEQLDRIAGMTGENGRGKIPAFSVPILRFNGNTGKFSLTRVVDKEKTEEEISKPVEIVILRKRKALSSFSSQADYFTHEYNSPNDSVSLFKKIDGVITFEKKDTVPNLRQLYQALRSKQVLYVLFRGELTKFEVRGASQVELFDFFNKIGEEEIPVFSITTKVDSVGTKSDKGFAYQVLKFEMGETEVDLDLVESTLKTLNEKLAEIDAYFASKDGERSQPKEMSDAEKEYEALGKSEAVIEIGEEEIDPDAIPF